MLMKGRTQPRRTGAGKRLKCRLGSCESRHLDGVPGRGVITRRERERESLPASITRLPRRMSSHDVMKAISAR
jgi:hypothetical protein